MAYLKALGVEQRLRKAGRFLFKQLSLDIVHEGLKRLNSSSSPALDGFSAKFFKRFSEIFEPQMYESLKRFLDVGTIPETWTSGVVTMIPKTKAMQTPDSLRLSTCTHCLPGLLALTRLNTYTRYWMFMTMKSRALLTLL